MAKRLPRANDVEVQNYVFDKFQSKGEFSQEQITGTKTGLRTLLVGIGREPKSFTVAQVADVAKNRWVPKECAEWIEKTVKQMNEAKPQSLSRSDLVKMESKQIKINPNNQAALIPGAGKVLGDDKTKATIGFVRYFDNNMILICASESALKEASAKLIESKKK